MDLLKLAALDEEDLKIISAHTQDAVMKAGDLMFQQREKRFVAGLNRFVWEKKKQVFDRSNERRRSVLHFDRVLSAQIAGIDRNRRDDILSLLALRFTPGEMPAGAIELIFSGGHTIRLEVECIEARLTDLGAAWEASSRPSHES